MKWSIWVWICVMVADHCLDLRFADDILILAPITMSLAYS